MAEVGVSESLRGVLLGSALGRAWQVGPMEQTNKQKFICTMGGYIISLGVRPVGNKPPLLRPSQGCTVESTGQQGF